MKKLLIALIALVALVDAQAMWLGRQAVRAVVRTNVRYRTVDRRGLPELRLTGQDIQDIDAAATEAERLIQTTNRTAAKAAPTLERLDQEMDKLTAQINAEARAAYDEHTAIQRRTEEAREQTNKLPILAPYAFARYATAITAATGIIARLFS